MNTKEIETFLTGQANHFARLASEALVTGDNATALEYARRSVRATSIANDMELFNFNGETTTTTPTTAKKTSRRIGRPLGSKNKPKATVVTSRRPPAVIVATRRTSTTDKPSTPGQTDSLRKVLDRTIKNMKAGQTVAGILSGATSLMGRAISTKERNTLVGLIGQKVKSGELVADPSRSTSTIKVWQLNRKS